MRMKEGDPLEIFTSSNGEIMLKKYSMMEGLATIGQNFAESLYKVSGLPCAICDTDRVVAYAGRGRKDALDMPVTKDIEEVVSSRMSYFKQFPNEKSVYTHTGSSVAAVGITPVINGGDCAGAVALLAENGQVLSDSQKKLLVLTATLLAGNMES